jgi:hypothetical protein
MVYFWPNYKLNGQIPAALAVRFFTHCLATVYFPLSASKVWLEFLEKTQVFSPIGPTANLSFQYALMERI